MKIHINGLTGVQWAICVITGFTSLIWNTILKVVVKEEWFPSMGDEDPADVIAAAEDYATLRRIA